MKLIRYSHTGWEPCYQTKMRGHFDYILNANKDDLIKSGMSDWAVEQTWRYIQKESINLNMKFCWTGIHVFFDVVTDKDVDLFLNHLSNLRPPRHEKDWPDNTLAYELDMPFTQQISSLKTLRDEGCVGAYIPISM